jgi:hypothetical protein
MGMLWGFGVLRTLLFRLLSRCILERNSTLWQSWIIDTQAGDHVLWNRGANESTCNPEITKTLQTEGLGVSLLILICQARDRIVFDATRGSPKNTKLAGNLYDSCQVVATILLDFLVTDDVLDDRSREIVLGKASKTYYPLSLLSPDDAMFSSAFAFNLHKISAPFTF